MDVPGPPSAPSLDHYVEVLRSPSPGPRWLVVWKGLGELSCGGTRELSPTIESGLYARRECVSLKLTESCLLPTISTVLKQRTLEEDGRAMRILQKNDTILEETNCRGRG